MRFEPPILRCAFRCSTSWAIRPKTMSFQMQQCSTPGNLLVNKDAVTGQVQIVLLDHGLYTVGYSLASRVSWSTAFCFGVLISLIFLGTTLRLILYSRFINLPIKIWKKSLHKSSDAQRDVPLQLRESVVVDHQRRHRWHQGALDSDGRW